MIVLSGCAIIENERILLLYKKKEQFYELPGGKLNKGESLEDAARREVKEEIGCEIDLGKLFGSYHFMCGDKELESNIFIARVIGEPKLMEKDLFERMDWIPMKYYINYKLAPNVLLFLEGYLK